LKRKFVEESEHSALVPLFKNLTITSRRAVKMNLANEGLEARMKDEEVATKKRKAENDKAWEGMFNLSYLRFGASGTDFNDRATRGARWYLA
jgi:hypothetical protein